MAGNKRQRELARAKHERQEARRAHERHRRRRMQSVVAIVVVIALVGGGVAWAVWWNAGRTKVATADASADVNDLASLAASVEASVDASTSAAATSSASPLATDVSVSPSPSEPVDEAGLLDCTAPGETRANDLTFAAPGAPSTAATELTLATNCGDIVISLDPSAPKTVASMTFLAEQGYFDDTTCHRLTTEGIYVLQCGDPTATGTGGPGYTVEDENLPASADGNYPAGTVAMANSGPNTNGSQFFVVYQDTTLPGSYTVWGHVTEGLDWLKDLGATGTADGSGDGAPAQPVFIESATVRS